MSWSMVILLYNISSCHNAHKRGHLLSQAQLDCDKEDDDNDDDSDDAKIIEREAGN